jgi:hypothetical protein
MKKAIVAVVVLAVAGSGAALAGHNVNAKGAVHVVPHEARTCTENMPVINGCGDIISTSLSLDVDIFPVFFDLVEYQEFDFSMVWMPGGTCSFTSCSDQTIGDIVVPWDGIAQKWDTCQPGPVAVTGWGWIPDLAPGMICIKNHPTLGGIVVDCWDGVDYICGCWCAGVGGYIGDDACVPCDPSPNKAGTLGSIKALFR